MLRKYFSQLKKYLISDPLLQLALLTNSPDLAAQALAMLSWRLTPAGSETRARVLGLARSVFVDDIKAASKYSGHVEYIMIHRSHFRRLFEGFVPKKESEKITEFNYHSSEFGAKERKKYLKFMTLILARLQTKFKFSAIISGNFGYVEQQELMAAAKQLNIPFIVLHKEAMDLYGGMLDLYKNYKFVGTRALFYNQKIRQALLPRVAGLSESNTAVVGIPRFDSYFQKHERPQPKHAVLFSFFPNDKFLKSLKDEKKLAQAKNEYERFHKLVIGFAARHPDWQITIKTKVADQFIGYVNEICGKYFPNKLSNLTITNSQNPADLIVESAVIIGFDSTALIEAMIMGRPVVRPDFRNLAPDRSWDFFAGFDDLVNYVKTEEDLDRALINPKRIDRNLLEDFLRSTIGMRHGDASQRTEQEMLSVINFSK